MKSIYGYVFLIPILLFGCQTVGPPNQPGLVLVNLRTGLEEKLIPNANMTHLSAESLWHSAFHADGTLAGNRVADRRRGFFLELFKDDIEPYTRKMNPRSKCLIMQTPNQVEFLSGSPPAWSDCIYSKIKRPFVRKWLPCGGFIWEITYENSTPLTWEIRCK